MSLGFVEASAQLPNGACDARFSEVMSLGFVEALRSPSLTPLRGEFSEVMSLGFVEAVVSVKKATKSRSFPR